jgi:hypothetical protein
LKIPPAEGYLTIAVGRIDLIGNAWVSILQLAQDLMTLGIEE